MSLRQASTQTITSIVSLALGLAMTSVFSRCMGDDTRPAVPTVDLATLNASVTGPSRSLMGDLVEERVEEAKQTMASLERKLSFDDLDHEVMVTGVIANDEELRDLLGDFRSTIGAFERSGGKAAVVIRYLDTGGFITYNPDELMYPASSIKGPYVISLYQALEKGTLKGAGTDKEKAATIARLAKPVIVSSDNESYIRLHDIFGGQVFANWCVEQGVCKAKSDAYERLCCKTTHYPFVTCNELADMWQAGHGYLESRDDGASELRGFFEKREESPLREGVDPHATTISKAGWFPLDVYEKLAATVDAGIVVEDGRTYIVVIMTNAPGDLDKLASMVPGIWTAHNALVWD